VEAITACKFHQNLLSILAKQKQYILHRMEAATEEAKINASSAA